MICGDDCGGGARCAGADAATGFDHLGAFYFEAFDLSFHCIEYGLEGYSGYIPLRLGGEIVVVLIDNGDARRVTDAHSHGIQRLAEGKAEDIKTADDIGYGAGGLYCYLFWC